MAQDIDSASKTSVASSRVRPEPPESSDDVEAAEAQLGQLRPEVAGDRARGLPGAGMGRDVFGPEGARHVEDRRLFLAEREIHGRLPRAELLPVIAGRAGQGKPGLCPGPRGISPEEARGAHQRSAWNSSTRCVTTARMAAVVVVARGEPVGVDRALAVGGGAVPDEVGSLQDLLLAPERLGILGDQLHQFRQRLGNGTIGAAAEVDQPFRDAVALGAPAVLVDQEAVVDAPALVLAPRAARASAGGLRRGRRATACPRAGATRRRSAISSVGKRAEGRRSHQIFVASSIRPSSISTSTVRSVLGPARRSAAAGRCAAGCRRPSAGRRQGPCPAPARRARRSRAPADAAGSRANWPRRSMRRSSSLDADMDMHAADQHPPRDAREVAAQRVVAVLVGVVLGLPVGEGVAGDGDGGEAVVRGVRRHAGAQALQVVARLADGARRPWCRPRSGIAGTRG